jgi:glycosyltransferase involved in cell wall biosynthesis
MRTKDRVKTAAAFHRWLVGIRQHRTPSIRAAGAATMWLLLAIRRSVGAVETTAFELSLRLHFGGSGRRDLSRAGSVAPAQGLPRVVLDGVIFKLARHGTGLGISRFWIGLMTEWQSSGFARHVVVLDRGGGTPKLDGFEYRSVPKVRAANALSQRLMLETICESESADVFVSTYYTHPTRCRSLLVLHDMTPEILGNSLRAGQWREKHRAIQHASSYTAVSANTARDFRRLFPPDRAKPLTIVASVPDPIFCPAPPDEIRAFVEGSGLPRYFFLFVGERRGYKNAELLFRATQELKNRSDIGILCVGGADQLEPEFETLSANLFVRVTKLSDLQLRAAYSASAGLIFVSKYEGFGLPILEAMACGCPVITCDNSSQREVAGSAALYVSDADPNALAASMLQILDTDLRAGLVKSGHSRCRMFKWSESADALAEAILACAASN